MIRKRDSEERKEEGKEECEREVKRSIERRKIKEKEGKLLDKGKMEYKELIRNKKKGKKRYEKIG